MTSAAEVQGQGEDNPPELTVTLNLFLGFHLVRDQEAIFKAESGAQIKERVAGTDINF